MKERIRYLDFMKLIAMIFVSVSHVIQRTIPNIINTPLFDFFYRLHMPIFFFVSGFLLKRIVSFKELALKIVKRFFNYVYPAVLFTVITVIALPRYSNHNVLYWLKEFVLRTDSFYWFLITLFILDFIAYISSYLATIIFKRHKNDRSYLISTIVFLCLFIIPLIAFFHRFGGDFLALDLLLYYAPFFIVGFIISNLKISKAIHINVIFSFVFGVIYIVGFSKMNNWVLNSNFSLQEAKFIVYQAVALFGVLSIYYLAMCFSNHKLIARISAYGQYSLSFYLIHVLVLRIVTPFVTKISDYSFSSILFVFTYSVIIFAGSLFISLVLQRNKYTSIVLFGVKKKKKATDSTSSLIL